MRIEKEREERERENGGQLGESRKLKTYIHRISKEKTKEGKITKERIEKRE